MRAWKILCLVAVWSLLALPVLAQGNPTGRLTGKVTSEGSPLPGVRVTVTSPNLQGERQTFSNQNGDYLFAALPPGTYTVTFEMEGLQTQTFQEIVAAAQTARLDAGMSVSPLTEEIVVTGDRATVSESTSADTTMPEETLEKLAVGRTLLNAVALAPGVNQTGPNQNVTISGSQSYENLFLINGVVVNENLRGQPLNLFIEDAIQETTTSVSGISAEYGRFTGGVVNAITKSGGNEFSGSLRANLTNQDWVSATEFTPPQENKIQETYEGTFGGRILPDRLWFFTAGRNFDRSQNFQTFATDFPYSSTNKQTRLEGKLTAALTQSHNLLASYINIDQKATNTDPFGIVLEPKALTDREDPQTLTAYNYTGVLTRNLFAEAQYSKREFTIAKGAGSNARDFIGGTTLIDLQNAAGTYHTPYFCGFCRDELRDNDSSLAKGSYFLSTSGAGSHDIVFGAEQFTDIRVADNYQSPTSFQIWGDTTILRDGELFPVFTPGVAWVQWFPIFNPSQGTDFKTNSVFVNDRWQLNNKWSFNVGARWDQNDGTNSAGAKVADDSRISPRLGASYDLRGDGEWIFRASAGRYVAALNNGIADDTSVAGVPADFEWDYQGPPINPDPNATDLIDQDTAIQIVFDWFDSVGGIDNTDLLFFANVPGSNTIIPTSLNSPIADELTAGFSKRLGNKGQVRVDYINRKYGDFYFTRRDLTTGQTSSPELGEFDLGFVENNDTQVERVYDGVITQFNYRLNDRLSLGGNWTWSHARGNFEGENRDSGPLTASVGEYPEYKAFPQNNPRGDLLIDRRNNARVWAIYDVLRKKHNTLNVSVLQSYFSGTPYGGQGSVNSRPFVPDLGYLTPPRRVSYWFTPRDAFRTPDIYSTDIAVNYAFLINGLGKTFELFIQPEVLNVFDSQKAIVVNNTVLDATNSADFETFNPFTDEPVQGVNFDFDPDFGQPEREADLQTPRTYRLSVGFRF
jgi:outer membrane receptor for ferrienterochelin and colicin